MSMEERCRLLLESRQVTAQVAGVGRRIVSMVEDWCGQRLEEKNGAMFVTHLWKALQRLVDGQEAVTASAVVWEELAGYPAAVAKAREIAKVAEESLGVVVPPPEVAYLAMYLVSISPASASRRVAGMQEEE